MQIQFTPDELLSMNLESYLLEADVLNNIVQSHLFAKLLPCFSKYEDYLKAVSAQNIGYALMDQVNDNYFAIDIDSRTSVTDEILTAAQIAACCYLFSGMSFQLAKWDYKSIRQKLHDYVIKTCSNNNINAIGELSHGLHNTDAIRIIHILKLLGLLSVNPADCRQLSLGAGHGSRELTAVHQVPRIIRSGSNPGPGSSSNHESITFQSMQFESKEIILLDNDPGYEEYYNEINHVSNGHITALHMDVYKGLAELPAHMAAWGLGLMNIVIASRIDHGMLPDVDLFLDQLSTIIDSQADFIVSVGAGNDEHAFEGRLNKIREISDALSGRGLNPIGVKLCRGRTVSEQRSSPTFGAAYSTTYQALYCRLKRNKL